MAVQSTMGRHRRRVRRREDVPRTVAGRPHRNGRDTGLSYRERHGHRIGTRGRGPLPKPARVWPHQGAQAVWPRNSRGGRFAPQHRSARGEPRVEINRGRRRDQSPGRRHGRNGGRLASHLKGRDGLDCSACAGCDTSVATHHRRRSNGSCADGWADGPTRWLSIVCRRGPERPGL